MNNNLIIPAFLGLILMIYIASFTLAAWCDRNQKSKRYVMVVGGVIAVVAGLCAWLVMHFVR